MRYYPKKISEIGNEDRIIIIGKVVEVGETYFVVDDGTSRLKILSISLPKESDTVRVFCRKQENDWIADIVQILNELDLNILKEVEELYNKVEKDV